MDEVMTMITQLIGSVGFPIAMCIMLYTQQGKTMKELMVKVEKLTLAIEALKK